MLYSICPMSFSIRFFWILMNSIWTSYSPPYQILCSYINWSGRYINRYLFTMTNNEIQNVICNPDLRKKKKSDILRVTWSGRTQSSTWNVASTPSYMYSFEPGRNLGDFSICTRVGRLLWPSRCSEIHWSSGIRNYEVKKTCVGLITVFKKKYRTV